MSVSVPHSLSQSLTLTSLLFLTPKSNVFIHQPAKAKSDSRCRPVSLEHISRLVTVYGERKRTEEKRGGKIYSRETEKSSCASCVRLAAAIRRCLLRLGLKSRNFRLMLSRSARPLCRSLSCYLMVVGLLLL